MERSGEERPVGGVGAGGGAGLYKARTGPGAPNPPDTGIAEAVPGGGRLPAGEKGAVLESWDGQCPGPIIEKVRKKNNLGAEIR